MKRLTWFLALAGVTIALPAFADGIVTLDLLSPSAGLNYRGGGPATIEWTIQATVSSGDNMGLALISVDLIQDPANATPVTLMPADAVPPEMVGFDRPAGISNPGTGYVGTQVLGPGGARNVIHIGGGQNTFGSLPQPPVPGFGEDFDVEPNVGQLAEGQIIAAGSFTAPTTKGAYSFSLQSAMANTMDAVNAAPDWSPVSPATVLAGDSGGAIGFVLCEAADADGSSILTPADLGAFVDLLLGTVTANPYAMCAVDLNDDGQINGADIQLVLEAYLAG